MSRKIFKSILLTAVIVLLAALSVVTAFLYADTSAAQQTYLKTELALAMAGVEENGLEYLQHLSLQDCRITWVNRDGVVLYDNQASPEEMENHADRQEIRQALLTGESSSSRYSDTLMEKTIYHAKVLTDGTVLRMSVSHQTVLAMVLGLLWPFLLIAVAAAVLAAVLAKWMARRLMEPLNRLNLDDPLGNDTYEELSPLLGRIHQQHQQIDRQFRELQSKTDEFNQITESMKEGLVLLDRQGVILSINPAAQRLFHAGTDCCGQDLLVLDRSREMREAFRNAMTSGHGEFRNQRDGKEYQFDVSRIESDGVVTGSVLLVFDITQQAAAERSRQEFTANVSHELKTPLQSIIGSAELIEGGLVKQEDLPRFIGRIRTEDARLVTLIEDIIRLSQLDEGIPMPQEPVDLYAMAEDVTRILRETAERKGVKLSVTGQRVVVHGVPSLLHETLYNLCDNAIKYNVDNGAVEICISQAEQEACIFVQDTGIGIPEDCQSRVFERFFRVDKSHSKIIGGTGLGLSIVKHAVMYHNGRLDLKSQLGVGTTISVFLPRTQPDFP